MNKIDVYYINMDKSADRRERIERNFLECGFSENWTLNRVRAVTPADDVAKERKTHTNPLLTANYLSHLECLKRALDTDAHAFIVEDDTQFGKETEAYVDLALAMFDDSEWDILYTDVYVGDATTMPKLLKLHRRLMRDGSVTAVEALKWEGGFGGAGAYIVNRKSKQKLLHAMDFHEHIVHAYDMVLKFYSTHEVLNAFIAFPFLTSISDLGDASTVAPNDRDMRETVLFHYFRRMVWIGADRRPESLEALTEDLRKFDESTATPETRMLAAILAPLLAIQLA